MDKTINWEDLHDATLKQITVDWGKESCELTLVLSSRSISVRAAGLRKLVLQSESPWGTSVSVNHARLLTQVGDQFSTLKIEMQSGDPILIEAVRICAEILGER